MLSFKVNTLFGLLLFCILCMNSVSAAPLRARRGTDSSLVGRAASAKAPYFAVYTDAGTEPAPDVDKIKGFNVVIMSFLLSSGAADQAAAWEKLSDSDRSSIKAKYKAAGITLLVSAFGSTETPTTSGADAKAVASTMAAWVKKYGIDGIDVDYEDITAMNAANGKAEQWLVDFTNALRDELPQGQYILTHAPMAPWMGTGTQWTTGAYVTVNKQVGSKIDWYNVQFYNQGASVYTTCDGLLTSSGSSAPKSSVFEIKANGFDLNKIVIGKPGTAEQASNGFMDTNTLAGCLGQAKAKGWNAGAMTWEYSAGVVDTKWATAVRGTAFADTGSSAGSTGADTGASSSAGAGADAGADTAAAGAASTAGADTGAGVDPVTGSVTGTAIAATPTSVAAGAGSSPTTYDNGMWTPDAPAASPAATPPAGKPRRNEPKFKSRSRARQNPPRRKDSTKANEKRESKVISRR